MVMMTAGCEQKKKKKKCDEVSCILHQSAKTLKYTQCEVNEFINLIEAQPFLKVSSHSSVNNTAFFSCKHDFKCTNAAKNATTATFLDSLPIIAIS